MQIFCIIKCPEALFKAVNYILVWSDWAGKREDHENWGSRQSARKAVSRDMLVSRAGAADTRLLVAPLEPQHSPRGRSVQAWLQGSVLFLMYGPLFLGKILSLQMVFSTPRPQLSHS